jgi:hypothetical protein
MKYIASILSQQWTNMGSSHAGFGLDLLSVSQLHRLDGDVRQVIIACHPRLIIRTQQIHRQVAYTPDACGNVDVGKMAGNLLWEMVDEICAYVRTAESECSDSPVPATYFIQGLNTHVDRHGTLRFHCNIILLHYASSKQLDEPTGNS